MLASVVGKIGEAAVAAIFSPVAVAAGVGKIVQSTTRQTESTLAKAGVVIDAAVKQILHEAVQGLVSVRDSLSDEYGEVTVIGKGGCKNGPFPGEALPDFVAISPSGNQPILIEVKNTARPASTDHFQASFYNTVARETGVVVHEQRVESGDLALNPVAYHESITDTLLIYPRLGTYEKISDRVKMKQDTIHEIWRAKQLGFAGKSPHTGCDSKCPHHRLGIDVPEGNLEPAIPLPLVYALGLVEAGTDLNNNYLHHYFFKSGLASGIYDWVFGVRHHSDDMGKKKAVDLLASKTGLSMDLVEKMAFNYTRNPDSDVVFRKMVGDFKPWEKILGEDRLKGPSTRSTIQGMATRLYALPDRSEEFVRKSWKRWQ